MNLTTDEVASAKARPTQNAAAYDLYVRGRNALRAHDSASVQSALDYFDQALKADPKFALAFAGEADASLRMYETSSGRVARWCRAEGSFTRRTSSL